MSTGNPLTTHTRHSNMEYLFERLPPHNKELQDAGKELLMEVKILRSFVQNVERELGALRGQLALLEQEQLTREGSGIGKAHVGGKRNEK